MSRVVLEVTELDETHRIEWEGRYGNVVLPTLTLGLLKHRLPDGTWCAAMVLVDNDATRELFAGWPTRWTATSLRPLTLSPSFMCRAGCADHGFIREGKWVPA